jgi:hypothetical protein
MLALIFCSAVKVARAFRQFSKNSSFSAFVQARRSTKSSRALCWLIKRRFLGPSLARARAEPGDGEGRFRRELAPAAEMS